MRRACLALKAHVDKYYTRADARLGLINTRLGRPEKPDRIDAFQIPSNRDNGTVMRLKGTVNNASLSMFFLKI